MGFPVMPALSTQLTIRSIDQVAHWDEFVSTHPCGTSFHTSAMIRALAQAVDYEPYAFAAVAADGAIAGLLVATKVSFPGTWPSNLSSRSILFAQPITMPGVVGEQAIRSLLDEHDRVMNHQVVFAEIRPICVDDPHGDAYTGAGYEEFNYNNYEMKLDDDATAIFRRMNPKRRNNIRANERRGVTVRTVCPRKELVTFYDHLTQSHCRSKIPLVDIGYFEQLFQELPPEQFRMTIADYQGEPIASACHLLFNGRVYWSHAGTYRVPGIAAQASLVWETIQWSIQQGYQTYDFAGAGWADETYGPGIFKARFGGEHVNVKRYRKVYSKWRMKIAETGYKIARPILSV